MSPSARPFFVIVLAAALIGLAAPPAAPQAAAGRGASPSDGIHAAAGAGDLVKLKSLLADNPALIGSRDGNGLTPLHAACQEKRSDAVALLLAAGADVKTVDAEKYTPLHRAAFVGDAECCRLLLEAGADPKAVESMGRTPLMLACGFGHELAAVKRLVAGGSDVNALAAGGDSVLLSTIFYGKREIIDFLIASGARLPENGRSIGTALVVSARNGQEAVFRLALEAAAKLGMRPEGIVSLHDAASGGSAEIGRLLLAKGADADGRNMYGMTPLHAAADGGRTEFVRLLLERGAKIDEPDRMGRTAWNLARDNKHAETADLLKARGASTAAPKFPELRGPWLGQPDPGDTPAVFAPGIVSGYDFDSEHSPVAFAPDGNEAYWTKKFRGPLMFSKRIGGLWTPPRPAPFNSPWGDGEPFITPDGKRLYFLSFRPLQPGGRSDKENIWYIERRSDGWSDPMPESSAVNAFDHHWLISVSADGTLYFSAVREGGFGGRDIYASRLVDGVHEAPRNLGPVINSAANDLTPFIAPDGSYLLFATQGRPDAPGQFRFCLSFRDGAGWTKPVGLGEQIDRVQMALDPMVTPDGRFMLFLGQGDIYWVRAGFIEALRPKH
jgi:ankyrin repeat protein